MSHNNRPTDVSIDLETLGNTYGAAILSIGAASFNRDTGKIEPTYSAKIDLEEALRYGRVEASTLRWWFGQSKEAQHAALSAGGGAVTMQQALQGFNAFIRSLPANVCVWGNGATFDITLLDGAFDALALTGCVPVWRNNFWCVRDLRTLMDVVDLRKESIPFTGTPHVALDDAIHQAKLAIACFDALNGKLPATVQEDEQW